MAVGRSSSPADQNIVRLRTVSNVQTHLIGAQRDDESSGIQLHPIDVVFMLLSLVTFVGDLLTDVCVAAHYFSEGSYIWGSLTLLFILIPLIILQLFSLGWYLSDALYSRPFLYTIHVLLLGPFLRYLLVLKNAVKAWKTRGEEDITRFYQQQNDLCILRLFESFLESAPQVLLQLYIALRTQDANWLTTCSAVFSLLSLAWCVAAYTNAMRLATYENYGMSYGGLSVLSLWRLFMLTSRMVTLVVFTAAFQAWIFLVIGVHWAAMFVWISLQKTHFCSSWLTERLYNGVVAVVYCFCFFNVADGRTRWRVVGFYAAMIAENTLLLVAWFAAANPAPWKMWSCVAGVYGSFMLGLCCMLLYYRCCHPSVDTETKTGRESVYMARAQYRAYHQDGVDERSIELCEIGNRNPMNNMDCEDYLEPISHNNTDAIDCESFDLSTYQNDYSLTRTPLLRKFLESRIKKSSSREDCNELENYVEKGGGDEEELNGAVGGSDEGSHGDVHVCVENCHNYTQALRVGNRDEDLERRSYEHCTSDNVSTASDDILEMRLKCDPSYGASLPREKPHYFELEKDRFIPQMDLGDLLAYGADTSDIDANSELNTSFLSSSNPSSEAQKTSSEDLQQTNSRQSDYASFLANSVPLESDDSNEDNTHSESGASGIRLSLTNNANFEDHSSIDSVLDEKDLDGDTSDLRIAKDIYKTQLNNYVFI